MTPNTLSRSHTVERNNMHVQKQEHCVLEHVYSPSGGAEREFGHAEVMQVEAVKLKTENCRCYISWINAFITAGLTWYFSPSAAERHSLSRTPQSQQQSDRYSNTKPLVVRPCLAAAVDLTPCSRPPPPNNVTTLQPSLPLKMLLQLPEEQL